MILVFILFSFYSRWNFTTQWRSRARQGILIAGMGPDLSYDNTRSERLNFSGMK